MMNWSLTNIEQKMPDQDLGTSGLRCYAQIETFEPGLHSEMEHVSKFI